MKLLLERELFKSALFMLIILLGGSSVVLAQSIELDKKLGAENAKIVEEQMGLYPDEEMTAYVRAVGDRLIAELDDNPFEFQFYIVDDPIPNAFALPGGYVYVTRGLLLLFTTEDELACVMGHEIIHAIKRHSVKQMRNSILPHMLEIPGAIVGTVVDKDLGELLNTPITTSNTLLLSSYSRSHETESDTKGIELASKAGYDPNAMAAILERLTKAVEVIYDQEEKKSYFSDHPYTPTRVKNINKTSLNLNWKEKTKISEKFPAPIDGLLVGSNPKMGVFDDQIFLHPELNFTITFPKDWETTNQANTVGAIHSDRQAGVFVGLEDPSISPEYYGKLFEKEIREKHEQEPTISKPYTINNHAGYLISMEDKTGSETMYMHILWLKMDGNLFKLIGFGPISLQSELKKTAESLRPLMATERSSIQVRRMRLVEPKNNESISELSMRSNNVASNLITALINGIEEDSKLHEKKEVKIIVKEKYH